MTFVRPGALVVAVLLAAGSAAAQDTTVVARDSAAAPDTAVLRPVPAPADTVRPVGPMGALWRSLLVPGWGQAALGRRTAAGVFIVAEGATLAMTIKTMREVSYLRSIGSARLDDKEQEREDWLVLLGFNHLLSALEAYVSAHLWDFPGDLQLRRAPGGAAAEVRLPLPIR